MLSWTRFVALELAAAFLSLVFTCAAVAQPAAPGALPPPTEAATPAPPVTVPFDPTTGHILVQASLNDGPPRWLVLDTGNQQTVIFAGVADELGLETEPMGEMGGAGTGSVTVRQASGLKVAIGEGEAAVRTAFVEPAVIVLPEANRLPAFNGHTVDGFLGASLIERHVVSIDYTNGQLTLHDRGAYTPPKNARVAKMKLWSGFPYFEGTVIPLRMGEPTEPVEGNFLLDLGASYAVDLEHEQSERLGLLDADDPDQRVEGRGRGIDGVMFEWKSAPADRVVMGGLTLHADRILMMTTPGGGPPIEDLVGNIGSGAFPGEVVTLDYAGERLILTPAE